MSLSRTVSEIKDDFSRNSQKNFHPVSFLPPADGVPLGIGYRRTESKDPNDKAIR